jgi:voltage-gated potassium channel Kch
MSKSQWILLFSFVGVVFGGSLAFWWVEDGWTWLDALYMTIISVTTVGYGEVQPLSSAGRVVAMLVLFGGLGIFGLVISQVTSFAVGGALEGAVQRRRTVKLANRLSGHSVYCGLGDRGYALLSGRKNCVVVDPDRLNPAILVEKKNKRLILHEDAHNAAFLKMVGARRAGEIIVAAGKDSQNLAIARLIRESLGDGSPPRVIAAVENFATRDCFSDALHNQGIESFGFWEQSLLELAQKMALQSVRQWRALPTAPVKLILQVEGPLLEETLRVFGMVLQLGGLQKLQIEAYAVSDTFKSSFEARFPEYDRCCEIAWHSDEFINFEELDSHPDFAFFAASSVTRSVELAKRCSRAAPDMRANQIYGCYWSTEESDKIVRGMTSADEGIEVFSLYELLAKQDGLVSHAMDTEGRSIHESYCASATHPVLPWGALSEFHRNSNRQAALQQSIYQAAWQVGEGSADEAALLEYLAQCEHLRWMAFHLMSGWRLDSHGLPRDQWQRLKVHPNLVPYAELSEDDKEKDRVNIRAAVK